MIDVSTRAERPKVLLLSPIAVVDDSDPAKWTPLAAIAVGTALRSRGFDPIVVDTQIHDDWRARIAENIGDALFLGVSTMTGPSIVGALDGIEFARTLRSEIPVVWGGYHSSLVKGAILEEGGADFVVWGVGEPAIGPLAEVLDRRANGSRSWSTDLAEIPNLTYSDAGELHDTRPAAARMQDVAPLDYTLVDPRAYYTPGRHHVSYVSSYGCPWRCAYCVEPVHTLRFWRSRPPEQVADDLVRIWNEYEPERIDVVEPNFSSAPQRVLGVVRELLRADTAVNFSCNMRAGEVRRLAELIDLAELARAGFSRIFMGLESGSDRMLGGPLQKDSTAEDARVACELLARAGIEQFCSFMHDLPGETAEDSRETIELAEEIAALDHNYQFHHFFIPFPDTELYASLTRERGLDLSGFTLRDWAHANTYGGWSELWPGTPTLRRQVVEQLQELRDRHPEPFAFPQTIPSV